MKKNNNNNLTIQSTSNYYKVFKSSLQYLDEYSVVASLPAVCCAMSKQTTTRKTSSAVTVLIVVQVDVCRRLC